MSTRDYKHGVRGGGRGRSRGGGSGGGSGGRSRRARNAPRRWPWFAAGFACGLLVALLVYLREYSPESLQLIASQTALRDEAGRQGEQAGSRPRFEFYTLLPEMEVEVPERELEAAERERRQAEAAREQETARRAAAEREEAEQAPAPATAAPAAAQPVPAQPTESEPSEVAPAPDGNNVYMLQVASFQAPADADRLKASLTLMGLTTSVQTVSVDDQSTWYRVRVGPYRDMARLIDARARLREHGLEPMVYEIRG